jgi:hypothetical protein
MNYLSRTQMKDYVETREAFAVNGENNTTNPRATPKKEERGAGGVLTVSAEKMQGTLTIWFLFSYQIYRLTQLTV